MRLIPMTRVDGVGEVQAQPSRKEAQLPEAPTLIGVRGLPGHGAT
jgi:hypothetical protein